MPFRPDQFSAGLASVAYVSLCTLHLCQSVSAPNRGVFAAVNSAMKMSRLLLNRPGRVWIATILVAVVFVPVAKASDLTRDLQALAEVLEVPEPSEVNAALLRQAQNLRQGDFVRSLYKQRQGVAIWTDPAMILSLRAALESSTADGLLVDELRPRGFHDPLSPDARLSVAQREILLTDTLVALGDRLANGRADPRGLAPRDDDPIAWRHAEPQVMGALSQRLDQGDIAGLVADMRPDTDLYLRLRSALATELERARDPALIDTLRVNIERARWFARAVGDVDRIEVNIPAYTSTLYLDDEPVWQERVIVGKPDRRTPVFVSLMDHVVLDPTWTVPRSIIEDRLYEQAISDPLGFSNRGFQLRDVEGRWYDPVDIEWERYRAESLPYDVVQMPGSNNALGRVKFMFDNPYSVYLHDTPSRGLFDREERALSHGCVRVEDPDALARIILSRRADLDAQAIAELYADADNIPIDLTAPLPVALLYWTIDVDEQGNYVYFDDIYSRDAEVLKALNEVPRQRPVRSAMLP